MKSIEIESHSLAGIGNCLSFLYGLCCGDLVHAQFIQELTYDFAIQPNPGQ